LLVSPVLMADKARLIFRFLQTRSHNINTQFSKPNAMQCSVKAHLDFFLAALSKQHQIGGIVPSQRFLINKMIEPIPPTYGGTIIELGAGTGALTLRLAERCPEAEIVACEIDPVLARDGKESLLRAGHNGRVQFLPIAAENLLERLNTNGAGKVDFVISGIPIACLGRAKVNALLDAIWRSLREGGMYIQFQHSLIDRKRIQARFADLRIVPVLLNFPPAVVYYARK